MPGEQNPFGRWVRTLRLAAGLTQAELAESSGISERTVSDLERGLRLSVYPATARQLAAALQVPKDTLPAFVLAARGPEPALAENIEPPASAIRSRLPVSLTRLIGREHELDFILGLLRDREIRLITVVGPGGVGKTRLASEAAAITQNEFSGGAFFVGLSAIDNPLAVMPALAAAVGIGGSGEIVSLLAARLEEGRSMIVLDTFEHVLGAAKTISDLLAAIPALTVLVTSRSPLNVRGERLLPLSPLAVRGETRGGNQAAAVELFLERALANSPLIARDGDTIALASDICVRLDGLPLAVELAAARVKHMAIADLARHLDHRLQTLVGGAPDSPPRHQTMRSTLDWSYALLDGTQQRLFRSLAVFRGGFTHAAVLAVAADTGMSGDPQIIDGLSGLVDASLVVVEHGVSGQGRYRLLDVVRDYAVECASDAREIDALQRRHAEFFGALAQEAEPKLRGNEQREWHARLLEDEANFRAALAWALDGGETATAVRLAGSLWMFWRWAGLFDEGRAWLDAALAAGENAPSSERFQALWGAGWLAYHQGDYRRTDELGQQMVELLGAAENGLQRRNALTLIGNAALAMGNLDEATAALAEALAICEQLGNEWALATSLLNLGHATLRQGRAEDATALFARALSGYQAVGDQHFMARTYIQLGYAALESHDHGEASDRIAAAMRMTAELGDMWSIADGLEAVACECAERAPETAATLAGAALRVRERIAMNAHPADQIITRRHLDRARSRLGSERFAAAWEAGRAMVLSAAIATALVVSSEKERAAQQS
jgi:predicted ATPase/DNA-binding XRE family transcriptional regulator